ncbi:hypothetical protein KR009_005465 [Drosophila setifemur]|nr:hypothetical protein KR009_005465 [Drosophila setifemur]
MLVEKVHPLDNCEVFIQLRQMLQSYERKAKCLRNIIYWSGNERHVMELCAQVLVIMLENDLILQHTHYERKDELVAYPAGPLALNHLRGILAYMVVNTSVGCHIEQANWGPACAHLWNQVSVLPQFLTTAIALRCGMEQPLMEFLACGPRWVTTQYFESLSETVSSVHKHRMDALPVVLGTIRCSIRAIIYHNIPTANEMTVRQVGQLLQRHLLDSDERLKELRPDQRKIYQAHAMEQLLDIVIETLDEGREDVRQKPSYFQVYSQMSVDISASYHPDPQPHLRLLAKVLLDALQRVLQLVTVDTYMYWVELPSSRFLYNYQQLVCLQASKLLKLLDKEPDLGQHSICAQLKNFAQSAQNLEQRIAVLTLGHLLSFLDGEKGQISEEEMHLGLKELFNRPIGFGSDECVVTMSQHLDLLHVEHAKIILAHLGQVVEARKIVRDVKEEMRGDRYMEENESVVTEEEDEYETVVLLVLRPIYLKSSPKEKLELLEMRDKLGVTNAFRFERPADQEMHISFFNHLDYERIFPMDDFLNLCFFKAEDTWVDLGRLATTHTRFAALFWRLVCLCSRHAVHYVSKCTEQFFQDEQLLLKPNAPRFLLSLYGQLLILNGLCRSSGSRMYEVSLGDKSYPYNEEMLKGAQVQYLEACAAGLSKFTESHNYTVLLRILNILLEIAGSEAQLQIVSRQQMRKLKQVQPIDAETGVLAEATRYVAMHALLPEWRQGNWMLISQLMITMDTLRWNLATYNPIRVEVLGLVVRYWKQNMPHLLPLEDDFRQKMIEMAVTLNHSDFWMMDELKPHSLNYPREFIVLVTQASAQEATKLFRQSLETRTDRAIWCELSQLVYQANCEAAFEAFSFLFKRYMLAFRRYHRRGGKQGKKRRRQFERLMAIVNISPQPIRDATMLEARKGYMSTLGKRAIKPRKLSRD